MTVAKRTRERTRQIVKPSALTVEVALYLIIALMAVWLRLYRLDGRPMQFYASEAPDKVVGTINVYLFENPDEVLHQISEKLGQPELIT